MQQSTELDPHVFRVEPPDFDGPIGCACEHDILEDLTSASELQMGSQSRLDQLLRAIELQQPTPPCMHPHCLGKALHARSRPLGLAWHWGSTCRQSFAIAVPT